MIAVRSLPSIVRYASFVGVAAAFIGSTAVFALNQAQTGIQSRPVAVRTIPARPGYLMPLPVLTAKDFDVARSVSAVDIGKDAPATMRANMQPRMAPTGPAAKTLESSIVSVDAASVRSGPSKATVKTFVLRRGATVQILSTRGGWTEVRGRDGQTGWIWTAFLNR